MQCGFKDAIIRDGQRRITSLVSIPVEKSAGNSRCCDSPGMARRLRYGERSPHCSMGLPGRSDKTVRMGSSQTVFRVREKPK